MAILLALLVGLLLGAGVGWMVRQSLLPATAEVAPGEAPEVVAARHEAELADLRHEVERVRLEGESRTAAALAEEAAARAAVRV